MTNVVIADDEEFVRYFLVNAMESLFYKVVAEVDNGSDLIDVMEEHHPDILLLDINMPNFTGLDFLNQYASEFPETCIIILTSATSEELAKQAVEKGVQCFLRKDTPPDKMIKLIKENWETFRKGKNV